MSDADPQFFFKILPTFFGEETATQIRKHGFGGGSIHLTPSFGKLRQWSYRSVHVAEIVLKHVPEKAITVSW